MSSRINVLLLGAGPINFGTTEGPWNHTKRLEDILKERLRVVGLVDRDRARAERVLAVKHGQGFEAYAETAIFRSVQEAGSALANTVTHLVIDGLPPIARGSTQPGHDNELELLRLFPDAVFFIEKPISSAEIPEVVKVKEALSGRVVSVGYMLRYAKAVQCIKRTIADHGLTVMLTTAVYLLAYSYAGEIKKNQTLAYWDKTRERGPIVSQGTHLVDLTRYLSSEPVMESIRVHTVEHSDPAGRLSQLKMNEDDYIASANRIPRVTNAIWRTEAGGTASFIHGICLHEGDYDCEVTVLADGWKFTLREPYSASPYLLVRRPDLTGEERIDFNNDDCYHSEFSALVDVLEGKIGSEAILSSYADALETYKLTFEIMTVGEKALRDRTT